MPALWHWLHSCLAVQSVISAQEVCRACLREEVLQTLLCLKQVAIFTGWRTCRLGADKQSASFAAGRVMEQAITVHAFQTTTQKRGSAKMSVMMQ